MPRAQRRLDPGVAQRLLDEPQRFGFFQAVRMLERLFVRLGARAADAVPQRLRFRSTLSLDFPPSEIEALRAYSTEGDAIDSAPALGHAVGTETLGEVHLTPAFIGLLGFSGTLPLAYTERIAERELYHRDRAARGFLDIFGNRAVALFYAAWKKYRLALQYELDRKERFLPLVLALAGLGFRPLRDQLHDGEGAVFDQAIAHYCGGVRQRPVSAAFLQRILADYFAVPLRIEQFAGAWYRVPPAQRSHLGTGNAVLGRSALAGERVWQRDLRMRVWVGPLTHDEFENFLPGGTCAKALAKWLHLLTGVTLEYEVRPILRAEDVRGAGLSVESGGRLGWDAFVCTRPADAPRADPRYMIHAIA